MLHNMSSVASSALVGALVEANLDELSNINSRRFAEALAEDASSDASSPWNVIIWMKMQFSGGFTPENGIFTQILENN